MHQQHIRHGNCFGSFERQFLKIKNVHLSYMGSTLKYFSNGKKGRDEQCDQSLLRVWMVKWELYPLPCFWQGMSSFGATQCKYKIVFKKQSFSIQLRQKKQKIQKPQFTKSDCDHLTVIVKFQVVALW